MKNKSATWLLLLCLAKFSFAADHASQPAELIEASHKAVDLSELGPYQLRATVKWKLGKEVTGQVTVFRDKERYRYRLTLADYQEDRWIINNKLYVSRNHYPPPPKTLLLRLVDRWWLVTPNPSWEKSKVSKERQHGRTEECFEARTGNLTREKLCFDEQTSVLLKRTGFESSAVEFEDYAAFERKLYPRRAVVKERDQVVLELTDITITKADGPAEDMLVPARAAEFPTCNAPVPARKIKDSVPSIPHHTLLMKGGSAKVYVYGVIAADGSIQNPAVEYSSHPDFTQSALEALKQWRYSPAMCGQEPIPDETEFHFFYFVP